MRNWYSAKGCFLAGMEERLPSKGDDDVEEQLPHATPELTGKSLLNSVGIFFCVASMSSDPLTALSTVKKQTPLCHNTINKNEISALHYSF